MKPRRDVFNSISLTGSAAMRLISSNTSEAA